MHDETHSVPGSVAVSTIPQEENSSTPTLSVVTSEADLEINTDSDIVEIPVPFCEIPTSNADTVYATQLLETYLEEHGNGGSNSQSGDSREEMHRETYEEAMISQSSISESSQGTLVTVWKQTETLELINAYELFKDNFNHAKKRKYVWGSIAAYLESRGILKSEKAIETKWKNLLRTYKSIKDNNSKTGRGSVRFQFMEEMENVLGQRPLVSCQATVSLGISGLVDSSNKRKGQKSEENTISAVTETANDTDFETPKKRKNKENVTPALKKSYIKLKMEEINNKNKGRQEYLDFLKAEKIKKREREEKLIELRQRELDIEERKVKAIESLAFSRKQEFA